MAISSNNMGNINPNMGNTVPPAVPTLGEGKLELQRKNNRGKIVGLVIGGVTVVLIVVGGITYSVSLGSGYSNNNNNVAIVTSTPSMDSSAVADDGVNADADDLTPYDEVQTTNDEGPVAIKSAKISSIDSTVINIETADGKKVVGDNNATFIDKDPTGANPTDVALSKIQEARINGEMVFVDAISINRLESGTPVFIATYKGERYRIPASKMSVRKQIDSNDLVQYKMPAEFNSISHVTLKINDKLILLTKVTGIKEEVIDGVKMTFIAYLGSDGGYYSEGVLSNSYSITGMTTIDTQKLYNGAVPCDAVSVFPNTDKPRGVNYENVRIAKCKDSKGDSYDIYIFGFQGTEMEKVSIDNVIIQTKVKPDETIDPSTQVKDERYGTFGENEEMHLKSDIKNEEKGIDAFNNSNSLYYRFYDGNNNVFSVSSFDTSTSVYLGEANDETFNKVSPNYTLLDGDKVSGSFANNGIVSGLPKVCGCYFSKENGIIIAHFLTMDIGKYYDCSAPAGLIDLSGNEIDIEKAMVKQ